MQEFILRFIPDALRSDTDTFRRARLLVAIALVSAFTATFYAVQYAVTLHLYVASIGLALAALALVVVPLVLRSTASLPIAGNFVVGAFLFTQVILIYFEGGPLSQARYWAVLMPLLATLFNGAASGLRWFGVTAVLYGTVFLMNVLGYQFPAGLPEEQLRIQAFIGVAGLVIAVHVMARLFESGTNATLDQVQETRRAAERRAAQDYHALEELKTSNERRAAEDLQRIEAQSDYLSTSVEKILSHVDRMAKGDLTIEVSVGANDDIQRLSEGLTRSVADVRQMLVQVVQSVQVTMQALTAISSATEEIAATAQQQSSQVVEVAESVEKMSRTIAANTEQTSVAAFEAAEANGDALRGGEVMHRMIANVRQVGAVVLDSSEKVTRLGQSSEQINQIVAVIDEIAEQTNLLALNAAIEAARAGEQGRGFAVVADEVRKLAERTQKATREISTMIETIQHDMRDAVESMNTGRDLVTEGANLIEQTSQALENIVSRTSKVSDVISQVAVASEEQAATSDEMARNMSRMSRMVEESTKGLTEIAQSIEELLRQTQELERLIGRFTIDAPQHTVQQLAERQQRLLDS
jgi:methyl-accepting chemotaxis protein